MLNGIHHVSINVQDVDAAVQFYVGVLGMEQIERPDLGFPVRGSEVAIKRSICSVSSPPHRRKSSTLRSLWTIWLSSPVSWKPQAARVPNPGKFLVSVCRRSPMIRAATWSSSISDWLRATSPTAHALVARVTATV